MPEGRFLYSKTILSPVVDRRRLQIARAHAPSDLEARFRAGTSPVLPTNKIIFQSNDQSAFVFRGIAIRICMQTRRIDRIPGGTCTIGGRPAGVRLAGKI